MKQTKILFTAAIFLSLAGSCFAFSSPGNLNTSTKDYPAWVTKPSSDYPERLYITTVGSGPDEQSAKDSALAELSKYFITEIQSTQNTVIHDDQVKETVNLAQDITSKTKLQEISGVKTAEVYYSKNGKVFTLLVLDRAKAADYYAGLIEKNNSAIQKLITAADSKPGLLSNCSLCSKALSLARMNEYYYFLNTLINSPYPQYIDFSYGSIQELELACTNIRNKIFLSINITGDSKNKIKTAATSAFNKLGLSPKDDNSSRYLVQIELTFEQADNADSKNVYINYELTAVIKDTVTGSAVYSYEKSGREGHSTLSNAQTRVYSSVCKILTEEFSENLSNYLSENQK